jgi:glutathione S-transferase
LNPISRNKLEKTAMLKIYGHEVSGNSYKVKLLASLLQLEYKWIRIESVRQLPNFVGMGGV